jgi:hypothetical protein
MGRVVEQIPQVFHGVRAFFEQVESHALGGLRPHSREFLEGFHHGFKGSWEFHRLQLEPRDVQSTREAAGDL